MSSITIAGNTSGSITLQAPDVAGTTVLNLPSGNGDIVTKDGSGNVSIGGTLTASSFSGDGAGLSNLPIPAGYKGVTLDVITSSTTWTKPANIDYFYIALFGAGGGGGGDQYSNTGGCGGNGGIVHAIVPSSSIPDTVDITIGIGGTAKASGGGTSSFGPYMTATGGGLGANSTATVAAQGNGTSTIGTLIGGTTLSAYVALTINGDYGLMPAGIMSFYKTSLRARGSGASPIAYNFTSSHWAGAGGQGDQSTSNNPAGGVNGACIIMY